MEQCEGLRSQSVPTSLSSLIRMPLPLLSLSATIPKNFPTILFLSARPLGRWHFVPKDDCKLHGWAIEHFLPPPVFECFAKKGHPMCPGPSVLQAHFPPLPAFNLPRGRPTHACNEHMCAPAPAAWGLSLPHPCGSIIMSSSSSSFLLMHTTRPPTHTHAHTTTGGPAHQQHARLHVPMAAVTFKENSFWGLARNG